MKYLILLSLIFSLNAHSRSKVMLEQYVENGMIKTRKKTLDGIGPSQIEKVRVSEQNDPVTNVKTNKVTVFVSQCKEIELTDSKAQSLKNGDAIRFKLGSGSCQIESWEKYQF